jgi:hypothetical protein
MVGLAIAPFLLGLVILPGMPEQVAFAFEYLSVKPEFLSLDYLVDLWPQTYTSFWGTFGWMNVSTPRWIAHVLNAITAAGLLGALALLVRRKWEANAISPLGSSLLVLWVTCGLGVIAFIRLNLGIRQPQGRYLFTALPALVIIVAMYMVIFILT